MPLAPIDSIRRAFDRVRDAEDGDGALLSRYRQGRDQEAFGSLVRRHGPMVLGVCRRVLRDPHAADDAYQATFLVLARRADAVRPPERLGPWLYGVAYRTALKARGRAFRRARVERAYAAGASARTAADPAECAAALPVIDEQLSALPEKYRDPLVLCAVQGLNKAEAAERLGVPEGTVSSRLARARELLRDRLTRRGVVVPAAALGVLLSGETLRASVPPALAAAGAEVAAGTAAVSAPVLALSNEVLRSMTLLKLKTLCVVALSAALVGGGFGAYTLSADEKKPQPVPNGEKKPQPVPDKPTKNVDEKNGNNNQNGQNEKNGNNNQNGEGNKPKPDGEKKPPVARVIKGGGKVASVDAKANTVMLAVKGDSGVVERLYPLAPGAKVLVDGKEAKLDAVPKNATATFLANAAREGMLPQITELRVAGSNLTGVIKQVDAASITLAGEKAERVVKLAPGGKVTVGGKAAKLTDLKAGDKVTVTLTADETAALTISTGARGDGEKPGKPEKPGVKSFGGKIAGVDAVARTVTLATKGEGGVKEIVVKLTADAKVVIDGKGAKIGDLQKGMAATFRLVAARDGQPREADEVLVAGQTFVGVVKQVDTASITIGGEKTDRVVKLAPGGKVMLGEKPGTLGDLKPGDKVSVTLTADQTGATLIQTGVKKPAGDKPKPQKEGENE